VMTDGETVLDQAVAWHLRLPEADETSWVAFTDWLEESPLHAEAYDRLALADGLLAQSETLAAVAERSKHSANDNLPAAARGFAWWIGGASVAAAAAAVALLPGLVRSTAPAIYETAPGMSRTIALTDGSRVELSGGSRLLVDDATSRVATLERGEALFHVRHDPAHSFTVKTGDVAVEDLGTVFSVSHDPDAVRVAVAEGSVSVSRQQRKLTLGPGQTALASAAQGGLTAGKTAPADVGGWRSRALTFQGAPLSTVVERLNRLYALHISLGPNLSDRPFTGMVQLTGDAARDVPHLAALTGTTWRRDGEGWRLSSVD